MKATQAGTGTCQLRTESLRANQEVWTASVLKSIIKCLKVNLILKGNFDWICFAHEDQFAHNEDYYSSLWGKKHSIYSCGGAFKHLRETLCDKQIAEFGRFACWKMQLRMHYGKCSTSCFRSFWISFGDSFFGLLWDFDALDYCK